MRKVHTFTSVSLDGYFTDATGDMGWAHRYDDEWRAFSSGNASGDGELLFGRKTYEMMASFWPTAQAAQMLPEVAAGMNRMRKYVVSRTLAKADWQNTIVLKGELAGEIQKLKAGTGPDVVVLGSGSVVSQLTQARLVDEYQIVVIPVVLGQGRALFETVRDRLDLKLTKSKSFKNGNIVLWYEPA
jgi:dihydrofolate reductase